MPTSEITPSAQKIDKIINRIEDGDIKIPAFQRGYVWEQSQVISLLDSIYHDYPIGSILLWNSRETLRATRNIAGFKLPDRPAEYPVNYVLDGQQRLSSIYAVFCSETTQDIESDEYNPDMNIFDIYFDFEQEAFVLKEDITDKTKSLSLRSLLKLDKLMTELKQLDNKCHEAAQKLASKFINYEIPIVTISNRKKEEVGIIFERINNTGTKLNTLDLMVAWTWSDDFHLKEAIEELLETLDEKGFGGINEKILLQCMSGIIQDTTKTKAILSMDPKNVSDRFNILTNALEKTVDFIATEFNCPSIELLPSVQQIVGLTKFFSLSGGLSAEQNTILTKWFWKTAFSKRYRGQTDEKMDADIRFMRNVNENKFTDIEKYSHDLEPNTLVNTKFKKSHPYTRAFLLLMGQKAPLDLVNGTKIDLGRALSKFNSKEHHHVFPKAFLKGRAVHNSRINSIVNYCILPSASNKTISQKRPSDYFFSIIPEKDYQNILKSNLLPINKKIYKEDNYDGFLEERASIIIQYLNELTT